MKGGGGRGNAWLASFSLNTVMRNSEKKFIIFFNKKKRSEKASSGVGRILHHL